MHVEVCIDSTDEAAVAEAVAAARTGGAARVELCRAMAQDGLTPAPAHIRAARRAFGEKEGLIVMIRPRGGDFCYGPAERDRMAAQIATAAAAGADGVALGVLRPDGRLDESAAFGLVETARRHGLAVTFHRAFDALPDPVAAVDVLVQLGVRRVLTCGVPWGRPGTALDGVSQIARCIQGAGGRLEVVAAGGVTAANVRAVLRRLPVAHGGVSVHAYSGVQEGGCTTANAVRALVEAVRPFSARGDGSAR